MKEEFKNFIIYKQYVKDEDVSIIPHLIILSVIFVAWLIYKLFSK